jgi:UDP-glucose 4-epimerase
MAGPRVLVTGATGFIGRHLCDRLANPGSWTAVGRTNPAKFALPLAYRSADLSIEAEARAAIPPGTDVLVHLASYRGAPNDVTGHFRTTSAATLYLCDAARRAGVKRIVLMSTTSVYEPSLPADALLGEDARRARKRPLAYGFSKKWAEDAARLQAMLSDHDMRLWVLRPGVVVGPGLRNSSWLRSTVRRLASGQSYPLTGERGHRLGLVAVEDVIDALAVAIGGSEPEGTEAPGPIWNIVAEPWWERDVVEKLASKLGVTPIFAAPPSRDRGGWNDEPLSVAGDGARWVREMGAVRTRPVGPLLEAIAGSEV